MVKFEQKITTKKFGQWIDKPVIYFQIYRHMHRQERKYSCNGSRDKYVFQQLFMRNLDIPARIRDKTIYYSICWGKLKIFKQWFWRKLDIQAMVLGKAKYGPQEKPRIILSTSAAGSCLSFSWI